MIKEKDNILFCSTSCGNNMHKSCFEKWCLVKLSMSEGITCPFCRVEWKTIKETNKTSSNYLNLAAYSTTDDYEEEVDDWLSYHYW